MYPENFSYTKDHEWIKIEGNTGTIGITDFAQSHLGDVVFVELPKVSTNLQLHQTFCVVESVKAVADVYSPLSGEVTEVNEKLANKPELINEDPHGNGWIAKIRIADESELQQLMTASEYEKFIEGQQ